MSCEGAVLLTGAAQVQRYLYARALSAKRLRVLEEWDPESARARLRSAVPDVIAIFAPDESYGIKVAGRLVADERTPRMPLLLVTDPSPHQAPPVPQREVWDGCLVNPVKPTLLLSEICRLIMLARVDDAFGRLARTRRKARAILDAADRSVMQAGETTESVEQTRRIRRDSPGDRSKLS